MRGSKKDSNPPKFPQNPDRKFPSFQNLTIHSQKDPNFSSLED